MADRPVLNSRARGMRNAPTDAERALWRLINRDQLAVRFRRQHPIGPYIADFACFSHRLIVEVDGGQHNESDYDAVRDAWLKAQGFTVLRFWNSEVSENPEGVCERIVLELRRPRAG